MSALHLSSYNTVCWRPGKQGYFDVASPISLPNVASSPLPAAAVDSIPTPVALACIKQPKQELSVWLSWKGPRDVQKIPKEVSDVLHVCTDDNFFGVFYSRHRGADLAFALMEHDAHNVDKIVGKSAVFAAEMAALMDDAVPEDERRERKKSAKSTAFFSVRQALLRHTARGHVVAAVVATQRGDVYGIVGGLETNEWRRWRVAFSTVSTPAVFIPPNGADARFVQCDLAPPADVDAAVALVVAPTAALALSSFERLTSGDASPPLSTSGSVRAVCAVVRECVLPTRAGKAVTERRFQSHAFAPQHPNSESGVSPACLVVVEDHRVPLYTIVVPGHAESCVVHVSYAPGGGGASGELVASATAIPGLRDPISVCGLQLANHPQRPNGTTLTVVLCRDMTLYACEHFGQSASQVVLRINNLPSSALAFPFPPQMKLSKRLAAAAAVSADAMPELTRMVAVQSGTELLCSNGVLGVFLRVSAAMLPAAAPAFTVPTTVKLSDAIGPSGGDDAGADAGDAADDGAVTGAVALQQCLARVEELSLRTTRHDLPDVVFREVIPRLRYVGTSQQEVMLMQRVYEQLLRMAGPNLQSEWNYLWALTSVLQRTLARRSRDNGALYTDAFFLQLADAYRHGEFATAEGAAVVAEAVAADVSAEAVRVVTAQPPHLPPEVQYVLDGLADGVSPLDLGEEVARRMVHTSTLGNGACVVSTHAGKAECVHCLGCVLLASCLDLSVFVRAQEGRAMRVCVEEPPLTSTAESGGGSKAVCVAVPPFSFSSQEDFEKALTLAADLLCVSTADASFRPDVALLSLAIGTRQHCLAAFVQLFAPVLQSAAAEIAPLANNTAWLTACAAALSRTFGEQTAALLGDDRSSGTTLSTTLAYVLYVPQQRFNTALFATLSQTVSEEFCTAALVACVHHQTERLVAATHNYAAAVSTYLLAKTDADGERGWQALQLGRRRLRSSLAQTCVLWSQVGVLSPYAVRDVAMSYRVSARNSSAAAASSPGQPAQGTVVSRSLVACFRLLCLVHYCIDSEDALQKKAEGDVTVETCARALEALRLAQEAPLPLEWLQENFVELVQTAATQHPAWAAYLLRLLQLSNVRQTGNARLKRAFYGLCDTLQRQSARPPAADITADEEAALRKATLAAEACATAASLQTEPSDVEVSNTDNAAACFIFSTKRDSSLPRWAHSHTLPQRQYLFSHDWMDVLWTLERVPEALLEACNSTVASVQRCGAAEGGDADGGAAAAATKLSVEMANPLFAHLCRLRPPVRLHAVPTHSAATAAATEAAEAPPPGTSADVVQRQPTIAMTVASQTSEAATPEKLRAPAVEQPSPPAQQFVSPPPLPASAAPVAPSQQLLKVMAPAAPPPSVPAASPDAVAALPVEASSLTPLPAPSNTLHGSTTPLLPGSASADSAATAPNAAASSSAALYAPADVAWWDAIGAAPALSRPSPQAPPAAASAQPAKDGAAVNTATAEDNGESSDTATSYTTSTSAYTDPRAALAEYNRTSQRRGEGRTGKSERHRGSRMSGDYSSRSSSSSSGNKGAFNAADTNRKARISFNGVYGGGRPQCCSARSPHSRSPSKKKCHCCHRAIKPHRSNGSGSGEPLRAITADDALSLKWREASLETSVAPLRPPPAWAAATSPPTLLSFATRLQPPEEPSRRYAHSAREGGLQRPASPGGPACSAGTPAGPSQVALLRLPSASAGRETSRVRLYTLQGERVSTAAGDVDVLLNPRPSAAGSPFVGRAAPLTAPAVPPSSVFVAPPALLHLPQQQQQPSRQDQNSGGATVGDSPQPQPHSAAVSAEQQPYPQAARAPVGPAPAAIDLAALHDASSGAQQPVNVPPLSAAPASTSVPPPGLSGPGLSPALPVPQPPPTPAAVSGTSVLTPAQLADFHRYTDGLLVRQAQPPADPATPASGGPASPVAVAGASTPSAEAATPPDCPGVARLVEQQENFIRTTKALMETRQAENEGFYRRVVESIRSLTTASQQLRTGLTPVEQSQLVRDTVKQRNELMGLNHQLLEMQLAAARVSGEVPPTAAAAAAPVPLPTATTSQWTQSPSPARASVGVSYAAPPVSPSLTTATTQTAAVPQAGMQATLSDLQRLNTELMGVSASAEAMDKAIKETREVIQRYERTKTAEALSAEGAALTAAMRMRTAAIEQRLSELPRTSPQPDPAASPRPSQVWTVEGAAALGDADGGKEPAGRRSFSFSTQLPSSPVFSSSSTQLIAPADAPPTAPPAMSEKSSMTAVPPPPPSASRLAQLTTPPPQPSSPSIPQSTLSPPTPPVTATAQHNGEVAGQSSGEAAPSRTSPAFTSVSSAPLDAHDDALPTAAAASSFASTLRNVDGVASPSVSFARGGHPPSRDSPHASPRLSDTPHGRRKEEKEEEGERERERAAAVAPSTRQQTPARVFSTPCDLRTLFTRAGGVVLSGSAHTPPSHAPPRPPIVAARVRPAMASSAQCPPALVPKRADAQRRPPSTSRTSHASTQDRFAMYRTPAKPTRRPKDGARGPSACLPLSYSQSSGPGDVGAAFTPPAAVPRAVAAGDVYADRQRDRRMSSIAQRMQQLEQDLFG